jgi:hypothetical protein
VWLFFLPHPRGIPYKFPCNLQEIAASFSGGSVRGYESRPAFVPGEICRKFRSAGEKFLHLVCFQVHIFLFNGIVVCVITQCI